MISDEVDPSVVIASILLFVAIIFALILVGAGIQAIVMDINTYFLHLPYDRALCDGLGDNFYFKDETFFGFGEGGSYGCFLKEADVP